MESVFRHPVVSLKKVARMPDKDRKAVLKELKHYVSKQRGGSVSNGLKVNVGVSVTHLILLRLQSIMIGRIGLFCMVIRRLIRRMYGVSGRRSVLNLMGIMPICLMCCPNVGGEVFLER
jgi:hypothetical protein